MKPRSYSYVYVQEKSLKVHTLVLRILSMTFCNESMSCNLVLEADNRLFGTIKYQSDEEECKYSLMGELSIKVLQFTSNGVINSINFL